MYTRKLTGPERARLRCNTGVVDLDVTCAGDDGYGPCGTYLDWTDGRCARGHEIEIATSYPPQRLRGLRPGGPEKLGYEPLAPGEASIRVRIRGPSEALAWFEGLDARERGHVLLQARS